MRCICIDLRLPVTSPNINWFLQSRRHASAVLDIGNESVRKIIINDTIKLFLTAISILVVSNRNSFWVLFDKIASVYFIQARRNVFVSGGYKFVRTL